MNYIIEEVKCGITEGGLACGPVDGNVIVSMKFNDGKETKWLNNVEVGGIPNFYLTDKDIFDDLLKDDFDDEEYTKMLDETFVSSFSDVILGEYEDIFESFEKADLNTVKLIRAIIWVTRCDMDELNSIIESLTGKSVDEIDVPITDVEDGFYYIND